MWSTPEDILDNATILSRGAFFLFQLEASNFY